MIKAVLSEEDKTNLCDLKSHLAQFPRHRGQLIPLLQMAQEKMTYLPAAAMEMVAAHLGIAISEVYGVATFYNQFRFTPPGRHPIKVCLGTACHVKGAEIILENFERKLEIKEGETTQNREFSIDRVACVGCCALAPVALVGTALHGGMTPSKVEGVVLKVQIENEKREREKASNESGQ